MARRRRVMRRRRPGKGLSRNQKKQVKRLISGVQELKAIDTSVLASVTTGGTVNVLDFPTLGDGVSQRDGDQITLKTLRFRLNAVGGDSTNIVRFIIFRTTQDNTLPANIPTVTSVLQLLNPMAFYNYTTDRGNEIKILYDRTYTFSSGGTYDKIFKGTIYGKRLGKKKLTFDASIITGTDQIYYLLISDSIAAPHPGVSGYFRLEYTDS